jgi:hypothetical protein
MGEASVSAGSLSVTERVGRRRRRCDFGSVRISERDAQLLLLIAEQYAITVDQLARLIGRTYRTARWLRDRWQRAGWVVSRQLVAGGPSFIWLSREGTRVAQSPYRTWDANPGVAAHVEAVTELRLLLDRQLRLGEWQSERMLGKTYGPRSQTRLHLPDAVLVTERARVAIEVELSLKSRARLEEIVGDLGERYQHVWYFASSQLVPKLSELAASARWQNVRVHHYPPLLGELRADT